MFVSFNQFYVFFACFAFGGACGILFSVSAAIKYTIKNEFVKILSDTVAFILTAIFYIFYSYSLRFPNLRFYMIIGVFAGITAYLKSLHVLLAKIVKKFYNILKKKLKGLKFVEYVRFKSKKVDNSKHGRCGASCGNTSIRNGLSNDFHKR